MPPAKLKSSVKESGHLSSIERAREALARLCRKDRFATMAETAAILTELLEEYNLFPTVVGGLAVELYTHGQYTTQDIDLVFSQRKLAGDILTQLEFVREGRHWYHPALDISVEIPGDMLEGADPRRVIKITLPSRRHIYVIGIEDIILDRLRACVHWQSTSDCEWGLRMLKVHFESLDIAYIKEQALNDHPKTIEMLLEWLSEADK